MECTYKIYNVNLPVLQAKIDKLNKKATKLNCEPITLDIIDSEYIPADEKGLFDLLHYVAIKGSAPTLNGWQFIGTIERYEKGNIVKTVPGETYPIKYRTIGNTCEHCNTNRRRKNTYLVKNITTNEYKAVGKSCLKDFLGHSSPQKYADWLEYITNTDWLDEFANIPQSTGHQEKSIDLIEFLAHVSHAIKKYGWMSRSAAGWGQTATADEAMSGMFPYKPIYKVYPVNQDYDMAEKAIDWAKNIDPKNDYLHNINLIANEGFTTYKNIGFAASIVNGYIKSVEKEIEQEKRQTAEKQETISQYVGEIKQRKDFTLTYVNSYGFETQFGYTFIHKFLDDQGNVFIWRTTNAIEDVNQGNNLTLKGTIKEHKEYNGIKQTHITRCKIMQ